MALVESTLSNKTNQLPHFSLKSTNGEFKNSKDLMAGNGLVVLFTCNHCPYAKALWQRIINHLDVIRSFNFEFVAINPNIHPNYPDDSFENMIKLSNEMNFQFHYLVDENQAVAKQFDAQCTPDLYVLNHAMKVLYRGAYDDHWKDESLVTQHYLLDALKKLNNDINTSISVIKRSMGCSIKWVNENLES